MKAPKPDEIKPKMPGAFLTKWQKPIPIDFGPVAWRFDRDQRLLNCEIAQPRRGGGAGDLLRSKKKAHDATHVGFDRFRVFAE